jgi:hypothetical protein
MPKYIVEQISTFRNVHVVEAENEDEAVAIAEQADDNWQEWLGYLKIDVTDYSDERISFFKDRDYFWGGVAYKDADGFIGYIHPNGERVERKEIFIKS